MPKLCQIEGVRPVEKVRGYNLARTLTTEQPSERGYDRAMTSAMTKRGDAVVKLRGRHTKTTFGSNGKQL